MIENKKLKIINFELNLFLEQFKELSYFSETDLNGVITDISQSFCELIGYKKEELIGKKHSIFKHPLEEESKYKQLWKNITNDKIWIGELRCLDRNKNDIWYKTTIFIKKDIKGNILGYVAKRQDITDKKKLENLSITDTLTNLYNRRFFNEIVIKEINRARRLNKNFVLMMIDIDDFKKYNDTFGHLYGDNILKKVATVLKKFTKRANDFSFRLGGDEFCIISIDFDKNKILSYTNKIRDEIAKLKLSDNVTLTISIGAYILNPSEKVSLNDVFRFSDEALYKAKDLGKNQVVLYSKN